MSFWYDPFLTLQYLESKNATQFVFETWIGLLSEYTQDFECQRIMFGLASILRIDVNQLPNVIINRLLFNELSKLILTALPGLLKEIVKLSNKIVEIKDNGDFEDEVIVFVLFLISSG